MSLIIQDGRIDYGEFATMMRKGIPMYCGKMTMRTNLNSLAEALEAIEESEKNKN